MNIQHMAAIVNSAECGLREMHCTKLILRRWFAVVL